MAVALYVAIAVAEHLARSNTDIPSADRETTTMFNALHTMTTFIYSADKSLDAVLAFVLDCIDPTMPRKMP